MVKKKMGAYGHTIVMNLHKPDSLTSIVGDLVSPRTPEKTPGGTRLKKFFTDPSIITSEAYYEKLLKAFKVAATEMDLLRALKDIDSFVREGSVVVDDKDMMQERLNDLHESLIKIGEMKHGYTRSPKPGRRYV